MLADAAEIRREVAKLFRPSRRMRPSEAAAKSLVDFKTGQHWDPDVAPYVVEPLDTMADREHDSTVLVGPSRSAKTFSLILGGITYVITCAPADATLIHMNQREAREFSKSDLSRTFEASHDLRALLGPAAGDDNIDMKMMRNGVALRIGHPSISCVSSKTLRWVFVTDADNLTGDMSIDELFAPALMRTQTFLSAGHLVVESNPAVDYTDPTWQARGAHEGPPAAGMVGLYNTGDRRRWYWPCPHCGEYFQALPGPDAFALLPSQDELKELLAVHSAQELALRYSVLVCPTSGCEIRHESKREMNRRGRWLKGGQTIDRNGVITGVGLVSKRASYWIAGVMACYQSWSSMLEKYLLAVQKWAASGDESEIKQVLNTSFAWPHIPYAILSRKNNNGLGARAVELLQGHVPAGVRFLTASVDVQGNRFHIQVIGWGEGLRKWIVDTYALRTSERKDAKGGFMPMNPATYLEDWDRLVEKVIKRRYPLADMSGREMPISFTMVDSGGRATNTGKVTERAYQWWRKLKSENLHRNVRLLKGSQFKSAPRFEERFPDNRGKSGSKSSKAGKTAKANKTSAAGDVPVVFLNTTTIKDVIAADLAREVDGPGCWNFPNWLPKSFYDELQSEIRGAERWEKPDGARNEELDLAVYNHGAAYVLRADAITWADPPPWAADWDKNPNIVRAGDEPRAAPRARKKLRTARSNYLRN